MIISRPTTKIVLPVGDPADTDATMRVTSPYGPRGGGFHAGIDVGNYHGGDVLVACADGTVVAAGYVGSPWTDPKPADAWWYRQPVTATGQHGGLYGPPSAWAGPTWGGRMVVLDLGGGWFASYAHMATVDVAVGQKVARGGRLGTIGDSGSAYRQPHVHFGLRYAGSWVDPWPLINGADHPHQEDDMTYPAGFQPLALVKIAGGNRLRQGAASLTAPFLTIGKGADVEPDAEDGTIQAGVLGFCVGDAWLDKGSLWVWIAYNVGTFAERETHFIHSALAPGAWLTDAARKALAVTDDAALRAELATAIARADEAEAHLAQARVHAGSIATKAAAAEKAAGEAADAAVAIQQLAK